MNINNINIKCFSKKIGSTYRKQTIKIMLISWIKIIY